MSTTRQAPPTASGPLYVFGDSLSDPGNLFAQAEDLVSQEVLDDFTGTGGRLSDGPVWAEQVEPLIGGGVAGNYAVAGARAAGSLSVGELIGERYEDPFVVPPDDPRLDWDINLGAQVDRFLADTAGQDMSGATAFLLIGNNDFLTLADGADPFAVINDAVEATLLAAAELAIDGGVGEVVISTLPVIPFFPLGQELTPEEQDLAAFASALYAQTLADGVAWLQAGGVEVRLVDLAPLTAAIAEDPVSFGIVAPYGLTLDSGDPALEGYDPDQVAFWNDVHPTEAIHGAIAAFNAFALASAPTALGTGDDALGPSDASDLVLASGGADALSLGAGDDQAFGGSGDDSVAGGRGWDLVSGGSGDDRLDGGRGADVIDGDSGDDRIEGGKGSDALIDGIGSDELLGQDGADTFVWTQASLIGGVDGTDTDRIDGGGGRDTLVLALTDEAAAAYGEALAGPDPEAALLALGIVAQGVEEVVVAAGRAGLAALSEEAWYAQADLWGLI